MSFLDFLTRLSREDGSDLYLSTGAPPSAKFSGVLTPLSDTPMKPGEVLEIAKSIMNEEQLQEFEQELEMNLAISPEGVGRFRVNIFQQRNEVSIVARNIQTEIPNLDDLGLPEILKEVVESKNGLVLFVGGTGSGKSTSLAALIDHRNSFAGGHIITIEDPVEYVHTHKKCIINQREVGVDTLNYHTALKNTLRQAPDVILIGEIRDRETMEHALAFAETGHLAISTLHANNANQALDRIINFFPEERRTQLLHDLGNNIRAIVSQRLIPTQDGKRCAAIEILMGTHTIKQMIMKGQLSEIKEAMEKSANSGMQTFDGHLFDLAMAGRVTQQEALKHADSANNLRLKFKLSGREDDEELDAVSQALLQKTNFVRQAQAKALAEKAAEADSADEQKATQQDQPVTPAEPEPAKQPDGPLDLETELKLKGQADEPAELDSLGSSDDGLELDSTPEPIGSDLLNAIEEAMAPQSSSQSAQPSTAAASPGVTAAQTSPIAQPTQPTQPTQPAPAPALAPAPVPASAVPKTVPAQSKPASVNQKPDAAKAQAAMAAAEAAKKKLAAIKAAKEIRQMQEAKARAKAQAQAQSGMNADNQADKSPNADEVHAAMESLLKRNSP